jgi:hypothetical protein
LRSLDSIVVSTTTAMTQRADVRIIVFVIISFIVESRVLTLKEKVRSMFPFAY